MLIRCIISEQELTTRVNFTLPVLGVRVHNRNVNRRNNATRWLSLECDGCTVECRSTIGRYECTHELGWNLASRQLLLFCVRVHLNLLTRIALVDRRGVICG
jgi:hypothetical protein